MRSRERRDRHLLDYQREAVFSVSFTQQTLPLLLWQVFAVDKVAELIMLKAVDPSKAGETVLRMVNLKHIKVRARACDGPCPSRHTVVSGCRRYPDRATAFLRR